tara:strand:+ start:4762 stop:5607 length:846 start_codon:yes stop_codon:yes gene_type:complete
MKILVTGGAGFVGANLIKRLLIEQHIVVSIDNYSIGTSANHIEGALYRDLDVNSVSLLPNDFDLIFHLAGLSRIQPSFLQPTQTFKANACGVEAVLEWARPKKTKIIYSGSSSKHHNPYQSPYAFYKYLGEEMCRMYRKTYAIPIEIVRFYNVYGPYEITQGDWAAVIGLWRHQAAQGGPITIVGDGRQRRDFTHIDDIVDGLIRIAFSEETEAVAWELGSGKNYGLLEVYEIFKQRFSVDKLHLPDQKGNYRETLREDNAALDKLGWQPQDRLQDYIKNL